MSAFLVFLAGEYQTYADFDGAEMQAKRLTRRCNGGQVIQIYQLVAEVATTDSRGMVPKTTIERPA